MKAVRGVVLSAFPGCDTRGCIRICQASDVGSAS